jgi:hypothetical protein
LAGGWLIGKAQLRGGIRQMVDVEKLKTLLPYILVAVIILGATAWLAYEGKIPRWFRRLHFVNPFGSGGDVKKRVEQVQRDLMAKPPSDEGEIDDKTEVD